MKKLLFLLFLVSPVVHAEGPLFRNKDTYIQQEFENSYQDLRGKVSAAVLTTNTSGQLFIGQGNGKNPIPQWDGRVNGPVTYTITTTTATSTTVTLGADTSLTGSFTTLSAAEKVVIEVSGSCQTSNTLNDGGFLGLRRGSTNITATNGAFRITTPAANTMETSCGFVLLDTPGSIGTFTYTVTFNSRLGGSFQFGEGSTTSSMIITGYPK